MRGRDRWRLPRISRTVGVRVSAAPRAMRPVAAHTYCCECHADYASGAFVYAYVAMVVSSCMFWHDLGRTWASTGLMYGFEEA